MKERIKTLLEEHFEWLESETFIHELHNGVIELTTPYLDRHNDCLQLYVKEHGENILLTDRGYIITDLEQSGCEFNNKRRTSILESIQYGFGLDITGHEGVLSVVTEPDKFKVSLLNLIQAMLAVNDLFYISSSSVRSLFLEDVAMLLNESNIKFKPNPSYTGKSGLKNKFSFEIPKSNGYVDIILQAIASPSIDNTKTLIFSWNDILQSKSNLNKRLYAILNDEEKTVPKKTLDAMSNYEIETFLWSKQDKFIEAITNGKQ